MYEVATQMMKVCFKITFGLIVGFFTLIPKVIKFLVRSGFIWVALAWGCGKISVNADNQVMGIVFDLIGLVLLFIAFPIALINRIGSMVTKTKFNSLEYLFEKISGGNLGTGVSKGTFSKLKNTVEIPTGVILAKNKNKYVNVPDEEIAHESVLGGTGSGKSVNFIATLLSFKGSMLVLDGKDGGELRRKTAAAREKHFKHRVKFFNPEDPDTFKFDPYEIFKKSDDYLFTDLADQMAVQMIEKSDNEKNSMWIDNARILLSGIILYNVLSGNNFKDTMDFIQLNNIKKIIETIKNAYEDNKPRYEMAMKKIAFFDGMADETLTGIVSNMMSKLSCFTSPQVLNALSGDGDYISPSDLEDGNTTIYFNVSLEKASDQWKPLSKLFLNNFFSHFAKRGQFMSANGIKAEKIIFMLDEFSNYGHIQNIDNQISLVRSGGVSIMLAFQSLSQLDKVYGKDVRKIILDNISYTVVLKIEDTETADLFSKKSGTYDKKRISKSTNNNQDVIGMARGSGNGKNTSYEEKNLIKAETFRLLPDREKCILFMPDGVKECDKVLYYKDKILMDRLKGE